MTAKLPKIDTMIAEYKILQGKKKVLEARQKELRDELTDLLTHELETTKYVCAKGQVALETAQQRKCDFAMAKEILDDPTYRSLVSTMEIHKTVVR
jgi:hypothetical protein